MKKIFLFLVLVFSVSFSYSEESKIYFNDWRIFSSFADINSTVTDSKGKIWCASYGGGLVFSPETKTMKYISYEDGLISTNITAITNYGDMIITGTSDGIICIIDKDYKCTNFSDISRANFANPIINDIEIKDNKAYIGGGFGITVFDLTKQIFTETITKMGNFTRNSMVNDIKIKDNRIYSATIEGLAYTDISSQIQDPSVWKSIGRTNAIKPYSINLDNLFDDSGTLYISADSLLLAFESDTFRIVKKLAYWEPITKIFRYNNKLYLSTLFDIRDFEDNILSIPHPLYDEYATRLNFAIPIIINQSEFLFIAYTEKSFGLFNGLNLELYDANSPLTKQFTEMQIDSKGRLWGATGNGVSSKGIAMYDGTNWHNFYRNTEQKIKSNAFFKVYVDNENNVYASSWGKGFAIMNYDTALNTDFYNETNSPLTLFPNSDMTIATGFKQDRAGAIWLLNAFPSASSPLLIKRNSDGTFVGYPTPSIFDLNTPYFLEIDNNDTKWIGSSTESGLYYQNIDKNVYGYFKNSSSNLQSNKITALAYDKLGTLWIGTAEGLSAMINPSSVITKSTTYIRKVSFLSTNYINCIHVDAINNKWVGTDDGVWVLSPDGTEVLGIISSKNSALTTDKVVSITSDPKTGRIYFSTEKGLFSALTLSVEPQSRYSISCYPQPFDPAKDDNVVIDGLVKDTYISITTTDGKYIRSLQVSGSRAVWDGRDGSGNLVGNGVYLVISSSSNEGQYSVGKIAVKQK
jgi:ligand-binding sensor domain-containing protein